jgi:glycosyltransferase involved in cell wall biosynthesis
MPVKNAATYLEECLKSIVNQTLNDWELIIIDDHSTDKSVDIIQKFVSLDQRINTESNEGNGIIDALTLAYSLSTRNYISRMDADDIMAPSKLEFLAKKLSEHPNAIITAKVKYFADKPLGDGYLKYEHWLNDLIDSQNHYTEIYKECVLPSPCWMMGRETLETLGGFKSLAYPEDYDLCFKAYEREIELLGVKEVLHFWRDYSERTSRNDDNYSDNRFIPLKVKYFIEIDHDPKKELVLWGAGKKGKAIAQLLLAQNIEFTWISNNKKKIGHNVYGIIIQSQETLTRSRSQLIMSVANPEEQKEIKSFIEPLEQLSAFWFC